MNKKPRKALIAAGLVAAIGVGGLALNLPPPVVAAAQQLVTALLGDGTSQLAPAGE